MTGAPQGPKQFTNVILRSEPRTIRVIRGSLGEHDTLSEIGWMNVKPWLQKHCSKKNGSRV